ncbi:unnamed protein product [Boreogadus saida]
MALECRFEGRTGPPTLENPWAFKVQVQILVGTVPGYLKSQDPLRPCLSLSLHQGQHEEIVHPAADQLQFRVEWLRPAASMEWCRLQTG